MTRTLVRRSASAFGAVALGALLLAAPASARQDPGPDYVRLPGPGVQTPASEDGFELAQFGLGALVGAGLVTAGAAARTQTRRQHPRTA